MKRLCYLTILCCLLGLCYSCNAAPAQEVFNDTATHDTKAQQDTINRSADPESSVFEADWNRLAEGPQPVEEIYTRLYSGPLTEFTPGQEYQLLLPYMGPRRYTPSGDLVDGAYGLVTADGMIVTDPIYSYIDPILYEAANQETRTFLGFYALYTSISPENTKEAVQQITLIPKDGTFSVTCEEYIATPYGVIAMIDRAKCQAIWYNIDGDVILDTTSIPVISQGPPEAIYNLAHLADGYAPYFDWDGTYFFIDLKGNILSSPNGEVLSFDYAAPFDGGIAPIYVQDQLGYLDKNGHVIIPPQYKDGNTFFTKSGLTLVETMEHAYVVIDTTGTIVKTLEGSFPSVHLESLQGFYMLRQTNGDILYLDENLDPVLFGQRSLKNNGFCLYYTQADGISIPIADRELFIADAKTPVDPPYQGYYLVRDQNLRLSIHDSKGKPIASSFGADLKLREDVVTGALYYETGKTIQLGIHMMYDTVLTGLTEQDIVITNASPYLPPMDGYFYCADDRSVGYKNNENEWVFRIAISNVSGELT